MVLLLNVLNVGIVGELKEGNHISVALCVRGTLNYEQKTPPTFNFCISIICTYG